MRTIYIFSAESLIIIANIILHGAYKKIEIYLFSYLQRISTCHFLLNAGDEPMKQVTELLINDFKIKELGYDFMGFSLCKDSILSFHHLILSKEYCKKAKLGKGYWYWNGVILCQDTAHEYLHLIQRYGDDELFRYITSELLDMKIKGYLDKKNLIAIGQILDYFEYQYIEEKNDKGEYIIKEKYLNRNRFL